MSAQAAVELRCNICGLKLTGMGDAQPIRDRTRKTTAVRCSNYLHCMVRADKNRRIEIGAEDADIKHL